MASGSFDRDPQWTGERADTLLLPAPSPQPGLSADYLGMRDRVWTIAPLVILLYSVLLMPPEIQVEIAGLKITGYRIVIFCFVIPAVLRFVGGASRFSFVDGAITLSSMWIVLSFAAIYGPMEGIVRGGAVVLDAMGAYLIARTSITSHDDLRRVLVLIAPVLLLSALILMIESMTSTLLFRPAAASIFGQASVYAGGEASGGLQYMNNQRLGLMRAYSGFSHPILAGVTFASLLPLYFLSGIRSWPLWFGIVAAICCIFSMSSIAFLAIAICIGFLVTDRLKNMFRLINWPTIAAASTFILIVFHFITDNGIFRFLIRYTFNPHNGRVRLIQWDAGVNSMNENPWFGVGYEAIQVASWLPGSLDAHFLAIGVRNGWFTPVMLMIGCIALMIALGLCIRFHPPRERNLIVGLNMTIGLLLIASMTVAYYAETNIYFMAVLGIGASIAGLHAVRPTMHPSQAMPAYDPQDVAKWADLRQQL